MKAVDNIRNGLIDKILAIRSKDFLLALDNLVTSSKNDEIVELTAEQKIMLEMSDNDIANGNLISQADIEKRNNKWLSGK